MRSSTLSKKGCRFVRSTPQAAVTSIEPVPVTENAILTVASNRVNAVSCSVDDVLNFESHSKNEDKPQSEIRVVNVNKKHRWNSLDRGLPDNEGLEVAPLTSEGSLVDKTLTGSHSGERSGIIEKKF